MGKLSQCWRGSYADEVLPGTFKAGCRCLERITSYPEVIGTDCQVCLPTIPPEAYAYG
jgi:hypothetical protein